MRDKSGRFVKGHTPLTPRDDTTGRFIKKPVVSKYDKTRVEVDEFLRNREYATK